MNNKIEADKKIIINRIDASVHVCLNFHLLLFVTITMWYFTFNLKGSIFFKWNKMCNKTENLGIR